MVSEESLIEVFLEKFLLLLWKPPELLWNICAMNNVVSANTHMTLLFKRLVKIMEAGRKCNLARIKLTLISHRVLSVSYSV